MKKKVFISPVELGEPGEFKAVFSTLNVIDHDGDVTLPGAFTDGEKVRISYWGHRWEDLPVGKGIIHADDERAWVEGKFFLDTEAGSETYKTVKNLGELQEWSYGFDVLEADKGVFEGEEVTFLKKLSVHEVSPVLLGAGIGTQTLYMKRHTKEDAEDLFEEVEEIEEVEEKTSEIKEDTLITTSKTEDEAPEEGKSSGITPEVVLTFISTLEV